MASALPAHRRPDHCRWETTRGDQARPALAPKSVRWRVVDPFWLSGPFMADEQMGAASGFELEAQTETRGREKRGSRRRETTASFHMRVGEADLHGAARNIGGGGVYVVTGDELRV